MTIDDNDKQKILDLLAKESTMVIMTAFVYAKAYVEFGEDITKAWTTATQQASTLEKVKQKAMVEAYDSFKKDCEARIKDNMVAMLEKLKSEIILQVIDEPTENGTIAEMVSFNSGIMGSYDLVQQKINSLKENTDGRN